MAYVFDLRQVCGGYAYFSTFTHYKYSSDDRYEIRAPSLVDVDRFSRALGELGQPFQTIDSEKAYKDWIYLHGWAVVNEDFAQKRMPHWLKSCKCIKSALGSFTDVEVASPRALSRSYRGKAKAEILKRDGNTCLMCGETTLLTLQHVLPFSSSGETSSQNMITLCGPCNQDFGDELCIDLYRLAGLQHSYEPSLLKSAPNRKSALHRAVYLSGNLMHTRCEHW